MMVLLATDGHLPDHQSRGRDGASKLQIGTWRLDVHEHPLQGRRNGDLGYRICEFAVLNPLAGCAARIIAGDDVDAGAYQLCYIQSFADATDQFVRRALSFFEEQIAVADSGIAGD